MALYTEAAARACLRNKDGKRVFYLGKDDRLTDAARDFLRENHVEILPAEQARPAGFRTLFGATLTEKPEHMTHLNSEILVMKDHPRIRFRGEIDSLEAEILLAQKDAEAEGFDAVRKDLEEILGFVRRLIRCDVLGEPLPAVTLCGLTEQELRQRSHNPAKYYGEPHFMPDYQMPRALLSCNKVRTAVRRTELACYAAFRDEDGNPTRLDLIRGLNRLSSLLWIMMIRMKANQYGGKNHGTRP